MIFKKMVTVGTVLLTTICAQAAYQVELTFKNGAVRTVPELIVQSGQVFVKADNANVPFDQIQQATFSFDGISIKDCQMLVKRGAYKELDERLTPALDSVKQGIGLPGNLDAYQRYQLLASFWIRKFDVAQSVIHSLKQTNSQYAPLAELYSVLIQIEQGQIDAADAAFKKMDHPERISAACSEFIRGRLAMSEREYTQALIDFSKILVNYNHDPEWGPAATFYEGLVYKRTGYLESASNVASELTLAYPGAYWGTRAGELK